MKLIIKESKATTRGQFHQLIYAQLFCANDKKAEKPFQKTFLYEIWWSLRRKYLCDLRSFNLLATFCHSLIKLTPGANAIKQFTLVIYCHSILILSFCVVKQHYRGNSHRMAVNFHAKKFKTLADCGKLKTL